MKIEQLFFISRNESLRNIFEIWSKQMSFKVFTIDNLEEAVHFYEDMQPDFLVIDCDDLSHQDIQSFVTQRATQIPVAYLNGEEDYSLQKPVQLEGLYEELSSLYNKLTK